MNTANVKLVRDHIAGLPRKRFNMEWYFSEAPIFGPPPHRSTTNKQMLEGSCNTSACIAGHTLALLRPDAKLPDSYANSAARLLGLGPISASRLFDPAGHDGWFEENGWSMSAITNTQAVRVLDHLLATGEVDWSVAKKRVRKAKALSQSGGGE